MHIEIEVGNNIFLETMKSFQHFQKIDPSTTPFSFPLQMNYQTYFHSVQKSEIVALDMQWIFSHNFGFPQKVLKEGYQEQHHLQQGDEPPMQYK